MQLILVAGFGNLGAKLLPLQWVFPHIDFIFLEAHLDTYRRMRQEFERFETVEGLAQAMSEGSAKEFDANVLSFKQAANSVRYRTFNSALPREKSVKELLDEHLFYCGGPADEDDDPKWSEERRRHANLITRLTETPRSEVLLYLATRPEMYRWYLDRYGPYCHRVGVDKPLATQPADLAALCRFAKVNPELDIRPIDHYLFKLDFTRFDEMLRGRPQGLRPKDVHHIDVKFVEENLDEGRRYFVETGIIRDMMPHVSAMLRYMFRYCGPLQSHVGNVLPVLHQYEDSSGETIVGASVTVNYWCGGSYVPVRIQIAKGVSPPCKKITIHWHTGQTQEIDLARTPIKEGVEVPVDWQAAISYLADDYPTGHSVREHFTFPVACDITQEVFTTNEQAQHKIREQPNGSRRLAVGKTSLDDLSRMPTRRKVLIFNFDGVLVHSQPAHAEVWRTWCDQLGISSTSEIRTSFTPGRSNRENVYYALDKLDENTFPMSARWRYSERYYQFLDRLLRNAKIDLIAGVLAAGDAHPLYEYHRTVMIYLDWARLRGHHLVVVSTNDTRLVHETFEVLCRFRPAAARTVFTGFDEYVLGAKSSLDAYKQIISRLNDASFDEVIVFDDYQCVLDGLPKGDKIRPVHVHTNAAECGCGGINGFGETAAQRYLGISPP